MSAASDTGGSGFDGFMASVLDGVCVSLLALRSFLLI